jgi:small GTP-binding protein
MSHMPILGVDITTKQVKVRGNNVKLILVDTAGQERYGKTRPSYYRGASAVIICFNKGERHSFNVIGDWVKEFRKHIPDQRVPIGFVGFITESEEVTTKEGQGLKKARNMKYYEIKVKDTKSIEKIMIDVAEAVIHKPIHQTFDSSKKELSDLIQALELDAKRISIIEYWGERIAGYCDYQCDSVPESFLRNYEKTQKFIKYPKHHIRQCVYSCPLYNLIVDEKLAQMIVEQLMGK